MLVIYRYRIVLDLYIDWLYLLPVIARTSSRRCSTLAWFGLHTSVVQETCGLVSHSDELWFRLCSGADVIDVALGWIWDVSFGVWLFDPTKPFVDALLEDNNGPGAALNDPLASRDRGSYTVAGFYLERRISVDDT